MLTEESPGKKPVNIQLFGNNFNLKEGESSPSLMIDEAETGIHTRI
jgi:hypothetical protein